MNEQNPNFAASEQQPNAVPAGQQSFVPDQQPLVPANMPPEHPHAASYYNVPPMQQQVPPQPTGANPGQQPYAMPMGANPAMVGAMPTPASAAAGAGAAVADEEAASRVAIPSTDDLRAELRRSSTKSRVRNVSRNALFAIIAVAAIAVLISMLFMPVLRIFGNSMTPTLKEGTIAVAMKNASLEEGDIVAFYYNNKVLVKRVIATPGSWVDITDEGVVSVDGRTLDEPYVNELALGECDIDLPYQVPDNRYFVMGDHRSTSVDSRSTTLGCISNDQLVGKVLATVWPLNDVGLVS